MSGTPQIRRWRRDVVARFRRDSAIARRGGALLVVAAPAAIAGYLVLAILSGVLPVAQTWLVKLVVDALLPTVGVGTSASPALLLAGIYAVIFVLRTVVDPLEALLIPGLQSRTAAEIDRRLMEAGERLVDLSAVETPGFGDTLQLLEDTAFQLFWSLRAVRNGVSTGLTLLGVALVLGRLNLLLPVALIMASGPHLWAEGQVAHFKYAAMEDRSRAAREMDYCARIVTEPSAAKEVRLFGLGGFFLDRFRTRCVKAFREVDRARRAQLQLSVLCGLLYAVVLGGGFWYVAVAAGSGRLTLGDVALYLSAVIQAQGRLTILAQVYGFLQQALLGLRRLFAFLDEARPHIALAPPGLGHSLPSGPPDLLLQHVTFSYPGGNTPVLENVSARLLPGRITALVGDNGAGKSTVVKLLTRMHDPSAGVIVLQDGRLAAYDLAAWRRHCATVHQDFAQFALTLRENIAVGAVALERDHPDVEQAARWAGVNDLVARLPRGYETELTHRFVGGVDLSGGEWQKVALARAFVRDAMFVVLDEPTAALDADAEAHVVARFREVCAGKTALLISHRFSTVRLADHILVLNGHHIVEEGTHAELLASGGRYATLFRMQAHRYQDQVQNG